MFNTLKSMLKGLWRSTLPPIPHIRRTFQRNIEGPKLTLIDNRTGRRFDVPIEHNAIDAGYLEYAGLKVLDHGLHNTAVMKSQVTLM